MNLITEEYRELNRELHQQRPDYGTTAPKYSAQIRDIAMSIKADSILDYGCGKGLLGQALSHMIIKNYDPAIEGLDDPPEPADLVCCIDVLEHIEPTCLGAVLNDLQRLALKAVFLTIATRPAVKTLSDGRNAHLIVEPPNWWLPKILERWDLRLFQATEGEFAALGTTIVEAKPH
jgi:hypothetical protein|tara:strand:+ start:1805 stop:2332 length:528 start_codon:yes stop_codon:yes gene_type:complete